MPLAAHTRLGPYEILSAIGAGGMGEVYRARDTRLDRIVAVKILPERLSSNALGRERFEREARAISSLSHPHICPLYDVGQQDGIHYLVMEYLEGQSLADRLKKGPLPPEQVLQYAMQITSALDAAHRHSVTHRDLKPGNIMLTKNGAKLLDFGLAKVRTPESAAGATTLAIETTPLTAEGGILGTLQYMAPEQLEGRDADARTDIFALGAVIYEMATGRRAFEGKSQASLISAIMEREPPPILTLPGMTPPALDYVVRLCLAKEPAERWQTAHDLLAALRWIAQGGATTQLHLAPGPTRREMVAWAFAGVASVTAAGLAAMRFRERLNVYPMRFQILLPANLTFEDSDFPIVSPDGRRLVLAGTVEGKKQLWLRSLDSPTIRPLAGTDGATLPFWSPDSRFIAFFADRKLKKIDVSTGAPEDLCNTGEGLGGIWNREGAIVFSAASGRLQRVPSAGGQPVPLEDINGQPNETDQLPLGFLPDDRHFLYSSNRQGRHGIYLASLGSKEIRPLSSSADQVLYAPPGFVISLQQDALSAEPFSLSSLQSTGASVRLADRAGAFSVSSNGVLAYRSAASPSSQLAWYNRDGRRLSTVGDPADYVQIALSPDEKHLTVEGSGLSDLWLLDLASGIRSRVTFKQGDDAIWSPDGRQLIFASNRSGQFDLYRKVVGGGEEEMLFASPEPKYPEHWSKDGSFIIFIGEDGKAFYRLPLTGEGKPELLLQTDFVKDEPHLSPDGRWIAYGSTESGRWEIYLAAFPGFTERRQVSIAGGGRAEWRKDGKELFYLSLDGKLMAVDVTVGATLETGAPRELFQTRLRVDPRQDQYCVTRDGQRFLFAEPVESSSVITVVVNWAAGLKR